MHHAQLERIVCDDRRQEDVQMDCGEMNGEALWRSGHSMRDLT